jgi:hypothetical protein
MQDKQRSQRGSYEEMANCTFKPKVNFPSKSSTRSNGSKPDIHNRLYAQRKTAEQQSQVRFASQVKLV